MSGTALDDPAALETADPSAMLRLVAGAGAQVREATTLAAEAGFTRLAVGGRPRAVVVVEGDGSSLCSAMLAALAGPRSPVPVFTCRGPELPRWVGAGDAVLAASARGSEPTLPALEQAGSRGCSVVAVGPADSPLAAAVARARGVLVPITTGRLPRASLWTLSVPLLLAGEALGLLQLDAGDLAAAADRLDVVAEICRPGSESFVNPAKQLALDLAGSLPLAWATSPPTGVAAARLAGQLAANAKHPCLWAMLSQGGGEQVAVLDGVFGAQRRPAEPGGDIFADRADGPEPVGVHVVTLREPDDAPPADAAAELARERGLGLTALVAEGDGPVERLASLVGLVDFASVYLALHLGIDPTPTGAVADLRSRSHR